MDESINLKVNDYYTELVEVFKYFNKLNLTFYYKFSITLFQNYLYHLKNQVNF